MHLTAGSPLALIGFASAILPAAAQSWTLTKVADSNTPVPGKGGNFTGLGEAPFAAPSLGFDARVAFWAQYNNGAREGVFSDFSGALSVVANLITPVPGGSGSFTDLSPDPSYSPGLPTFVGFSPGRAGIYTLQMGQLVKVVDTQTPLPGGGGLFGPCYDPSRDGDIVAFSHNLMGIFAQVSTQIVKLADRTTTIPGTASTFDQLLRTRLSGESVAFYGNLGNSTGIYRVNTVGTPVVSTIVPMNTPVPGGTGVFVTFGFDFSYSQGNTAFIGVDQQNRRGVYAHIDGQLIVIANTIQPGPGGVQFTTFSDVAISGRSVAFNAGAPSGGGGLWFYRDGFYQRVQPAGNFFLGGLQVTTILLGPEGLKGDTIAFAFAEFNVGPVPRRGGVYTARLCYANCDASTAAPALNVSDFTCFLNRFAAENPYANCDGSTAPPTLNVADFICFLNAFAAGCS